MCHIEYVYINKTYKKLVFKIVFPIDYLESKILISLFDFIKQRK